jgi:hypothetical protein
MLEQRLFEAQENSKRDLLDLEDQGYPPDGAWEAVRERYLLLPSEEDSPNL